jgi:uncharacterized protein YlzI (FlbEa/FlbD family)
MKGEGFLIYLTKIDEEGTRILINHRKILKIEPRTNTFLIMENGISYMVEESADEVVSLMIDFEAQIIKRAKGGDALCRFQEKN